MAPPTTFRIDPALCLIGDWVPGEFVPAWEPSDRHLYQPPMAPGHTPPVWSFKRVIREFGGEQVTAWERIS